MNTAPKILIAGGLVALWMSRSQGSVAGLGYISPVFQPYIDQANAPDSWITYTQGQRNTKFSSGRPTAFNFTPRLNTDTWTVNALALKYTSNPDRFNRNSVNARNKAIMDAKRTPIILKATTVKTLKQAIGSLTYARNQAIKYTTMKKPLPRYKFSWDIDSASQAYVKILDTAISRAKKAVKKADEAQGKKDAMSVLDQITLLPDTPTPADDSARASGGLPLPPEDVVIKNSWEDLVKDVKVYDARAPQPGYKFVYTNGVRSEVRIAPKVRQQIMPDQRVAPVQPAPSEKINPLVAGAAAAAPLILAAIF